MMNDIYIPIEKVLSWLYSVPDPEIPAVSVVDLGIIQEVKWSQDDDMDELVIVMTPTYSGCPATEMIADSIRKTLEDHGINQVRIETRLTPAWTTDWMSEAAKQKLLDYGIAPPTQKVIEIADVRCGQISNPVVPCPRCGLSNTRITSWFGSTPCKSLYVCTDCLEPFDYFKCH